MHREIVQYRDKLERLFGHADDLVKNEDIDSEVISHFTSYLCVRTAGYVESSLITILSEYVNAATSELRLVSFVGSRLTRIPAVKKNTITSLTGEFDKSWSDNLNNEIGDELAKSLSEIVRVRNAIAHGRDVDLSLNVLKSHFENTKQVVEIIDRQCVANENPPSVPTTT